jgi:hypothetical protein
MVRFEVIIDASIHRVFRSGEFADRRGEEDDLENYHDEDNDETVNQSELDGINGVGGGERSSRNNSGKQVSESNYKPGSPHRSNGNTPSKQQNCLDFSGLLKWYESADACFCGLSN